MMNFCKVLLTSCSLLLIGCDSHQGKSDGGSGVKSGAEQGENSAIAAGTGAESGARQDAQTQSAPESSESTAAGPSSEPSSAEDRVAATFSDGTTISQSEILKRIKMLPDKIQKLPFSQLYNLVLFVMVQEKLAYKHAIEQQFDKKPAIIKQLDTIAKSIAQQHYLMGKVKPLVTNEAVKEQYDALVKNFAPADEVGLKHILVSTETEAKGVIELLKKGESFDKLQKDRSKDQNTMAKGGVLGYFGKGQLPAGMVDKIMNTEAGNFVDEPVAVPGTGWSILFVFEKRKSAPVSLEAVRDRLEGVLLKKFFIQEIGRLFKEHKVVLFDPNGKPIPYEDVDVRLEKLRKKQSGEQPTKEDEELEQSLNNLKETTVVAKIGDEPVTFKNVSDFIQERPEMFGGLSPGMVYLTACEEFTAQKLLARVVGKAGIDLDPQVVIAVQEARKAIIAQGYLADEAGKRIDDDQLRAAYEKIVENVNKNELEYRLRVIHVASKDAGEKAIAAINSGKKFEVVAKDFCCDKEAVPNALDGYQKKSALEGKSSELSAEVAKTPNATVLKKPWYVDGQWYVIRLEDKRKVEVPSFAQLKQHIKSRLVPERMVAFSLELIQKDGVKAQDFNGKPVNFSEKELERSLTGAGGDIGIAQ
ncbi:MAG: peptidyl-prolyl cis-trans isomerase [Holosporales bacterium]|jgi:peptidyl-prolyl cis-trans isomerase C|nr:peptidyl-prolyl cis-trans isomerase [Holosporales bacterium]